jgi:hypothetical protein
MEPLHRVFPYPEPSFMYLSESSAKVPLVDLPQRERGAPFPEPSFTCLSKSPFQVHPTGPLWREMPITRAFFYISFRVPSKGALPPGSSLRAPIERDAVFPEPSVTCLSKYPVKDSPLQVLPAGPLWREIPVTIAFFYISFRVTCKGALPPGSTLRAPIERDAPFPKPSFTHLSKTPGKEPPLLVPRRGPMERDDHFQNFHLHISWSPNE